MIKDFVRKFIEMTHNIDGKILVEQCGDYCKELDGYNLVMPRDKKEKFKEFLLENGSNQKHIENMFTAPQGLRALTNYPKGKDYNSYTEYLLETYGTPEDVIDKMVPKVKKKNESDTTEEHNQDEYAYTKEDSNIIDLTEKKEPKKETVVDSGTVDQKFAQVERKFEEKMRMVNQPQNKPITQPPVAEDEEEVLSYDDVCVLLDEILELDPTQSRSSLQVFKDLYLEGNTKDVTNIVLKFLDKVESKIRERGLL